MAGAGAAVGLMDGCLLLLYSLPSLGRYFALPGSI